MNPLVEAAFKLDQGEGNYGDLFGKLSPFRVICKCGSAEVLVETEEGYYGDQSIKISCKQCDKRDQIFL